MHSVVLKQTILGNKVRFRLKMHFVRIVLLPMNVVRNVTQASPKRQVQVPSQNMPTHQILPNNFSCNLRHTILDNNITHKPNTIPLN